MRFRLMTKERLIAEGDVDAVTLPATMGQMTVLPGHDMMVTLMGRADNMEQMWQFQENLLDRKDIKDVDITNNAQDAKSKKIKFTMVFHYRNFTKKEAVL